MTQETLKDLLRSLKLNGEGLSEEATKRVVDSQIREHEELMRSVLAQELRVSTSLSQADIETIRFDRLERTPGNEEAFSALEKWKPEFVRGGILSGPHGSGKTWLCKALINKWASREFTCLFKDARAIIASLKGSFDKGGEYVEYASQALLKPNLLIVDDIGWGNTSSWQNDQWTGLLMDRHNLGKSTFFTTKLNPKALESKFGEDFCERALDRCRWLPLEKSMFLSLSAQEKTW